MSGIEKCRLWEGNDVIIMEGSDGGDEDGDGVEWFFVGVGYGFSYVYL